MEIEKPSVIDILDTSGTPALSSTSDMPIVETKPDATPAPAQAEAAPAAAEEAKTDSESATEPEQDSSANDEPKKAKGVQKRLDELTRQREEAQRRAEAAEQRMERMLAMLEKQQGLAPAEDPQTDAAAGESEPVKPSRSDYAEPDAYEQAFEAYIEQKAAWKARQEFQAIQAEAEAARQAEAVEQAKQAAREAYATRVQKAKEELPDFEAVAESPDVQVSIAVATAILQSENGPRLQYYLGQNPAEAKRLNALSPPMQLIELGKIEARLTAPAAPAPAPKPPPVVSKAPAPIKPLTGATSPSTKDPETMSMDEYAAYRKAQQKDGRSARH